LASAFSHALAAAALGTAFYRREWPARFWALGAICAVVPDADVIGVPLGISMASPLGHRGLSHSLIFAVALAAVVVTLCFRGTPAGASRTRLWLYFFLATASHGVLDALTDGGPGVAFFSPLDDTRHFFPRRPVVVSPIGIRPFFSEWGLRVVESEAIWIGLPCLIFTGVVLVVRRKMIG
jgi:inner membrane protein